VAGVGFGKNMGKWTVLLERDEAMKKCIVLGWVAAMAVSAMAGLSLVDLGGGQVGVALAPAQNIVYFLAVDKALVLVDYGPTDKIGGLGEWFDYDVFDWSGFNLSQIGEARTFQIASSGTPAEPVEAGIQFIAAVDLPAGYSFTAEPAAGAPIEGRIDLIAGDMKAVLGTLYVVPEPMSAALLAVGGLLLRRKR
jgi:hypothetical protein